MNPDVASAIKSDLKKIQDELISVVRAVRRVAIETVKNRAHVDDEFEQVRGEMRAMSSKLTKQFDGFMSEAGKIERAQIIADWRVAQLEKRVDVIETPPS